jgi:hypothetical protein
MVMAPIANPIPLATSAFSQGGSLAPTPVNNFNTPVVAPTSNSFNYTPTSTYQYNPSIQPQAQTGGVNDAAGMMSPSNFASMGKNAVQFFQNGASFPAVSAVDMFGTNLGFGAGATGALSAGTGGTEAISAS